MSQTVFHTVIWFESDITVKFRLGMEGAIVSRADAERVAEAMRDKFDELAKQRGLTKDAYRARVGVLEIPLADRRLKNHPPPMTTEEVDEHIRTIQHGSHVPGNADIE